MTTKTTKCPYSRRRYQQTTAYEKHLQTIYFDIVLSPRANVDLTSPGPPGFVHDENITHRDSDYVSDNRLEWADCCAASSETDDDM